MSATDFNERNISRCLVCAGGMFPPRRYLAVPNISWGWHLQWEADLVVMGSNGYAQEVEIKTSLADFKRDAKKSKHHFRIDDRRNGYTTTYATTFRRFWYAMPVGVWEEIGAKLVPVPVDAGVIVISVEPEREMTSGSRPGASRFVVPAHLVSQVVKKADINRMAKPVTEKRKYELARLGVLRYWDEVSR